MVVGGTNSELRGFGAPMLKSIPLLSVSSPLALRAAAVVLESAPVGAFPSEQFTAPIAPYPTKSTTAEAGGQLPDSAAATLTNATFPAPAAIAIDPVASGAGSAIVPAAPAACCTR